jgi:enoyl-CoA hydratase
MPNDVQIGTGGEILEIVLTCPERGNALSPAMAETISGSIGTIPATTRAILLRAEGADFCTGRTPVLPPKGSSASALELRHLIADPVLEFYQRLRDVPVPVIAAVQGRAFGVGCALAGLADVCIATESAVFCVPEMDKDVPPTLVMAALADRLPRAALARLVFTREPIGASEAKSIGLIGMTCPDADIRVRRARRQDLPQSPAGNVIRRPPRNRGADQLRRDRRKISLNSTGEFDDQPHSSNGICRGGDAACRGMRVRHRRYSWAAHDLAGTRLPS